MKNKEARNKTFNTNNIQKNVMNRKRETLQDERF